MEKSDLHQYQVEAVQYLKDHTHCYLAVDLGLGKTIIALTVIADLIKEGVIKNAFIFAPLRVVYNVWRQEAAEWEHTKHLTFSLLHGPQKGPLLASTLADVNIMNIDGLLWIRNNKPKRLPGCMLIIDEASMIKDPSTERFKTLKKYRRQFDRMCMMSGTPAPNSLLNIWAPYFLLDGGERLETSFYRYKNIYFRQTDYQGYSWELKKGAKEVIYSKVADITLRLDKHDFLDMPDLVIVPTLTTLDEKTQALYDGLEKDMFVEWDEHEVSASMAPTISLKCRQLSQGFVYTDEGETVWLHKLKIETLKELIEELDGQPVFVSYYFKADAAMIAEAFKDARFINGSTKSADDEQTIIDWNNGDIPALFVQEQGVSHGLNLQKGGSIVIWYSPTWSFERFDQLNGRLNRQGQKAKEVRVFVIMAANTVDELMLKSVQTNELNQRDFLNAMKEYRAKKDG